MLIRASFSKADKNILETLGKDFIKAKIVLLNTEGAIHSAEKKYSLELFTQKQSFTKILTTAEAENFIKEKALVSFKNAVILTDSEEITYLTNRHGETKILKRKTKAENKINFTAQNAGGRKKNYILKEGIAVPFLVELGVMTKGGKVISAKYDKFRQINHFLSFIEDVAGQVEKIKGIPFTKENPLRIADFGCGKSYLTFATYYFFNDIKKTPVEIKGLDLKEDVIEKCSDLAQKLNCSGLTFSVGDIANASYTKAPDIIITLHACDTATDFALDYAVKNNALAILSVPCCQHEINLQLEKKNFLTASPFSSINRYGLLRERFACLATDALRAELLEEEGYNVELLEFIDIEHTPKNILIRAVKKSLDNKNAFTSFQKAKLQSEERVKALMNELGVNQKLFTLRNKK